MSFYTENFLNKFDFSSSQEDIYYHQLANPNSPMFNIGGYIEIHNLNVDMLKRAHAHVVDSEIAFGMKIVKSEKEIYKTYKMERYVFLNSIDISCSSEPISKAKELIKEKFEEVIDVHSDSLFKAFLINIGQNKHFYVGIGHHIAIDGHGFSNWAKKLETSYLSLLNGSLNICDKNILPAISTENQYLESKRYQRDRDFWTKNVIEKFGVGGFGFRSVLKDSDFLLARKSARNTILLSREDHHKLESLSQFNDISLLSTYVSIFSIVLRNVFGFESCIVGVPYHNRRKKEKHDSIDSFASVVPCFVDMKYLHLSLDYLKTTHSSIMQSLRHSLFPLSHIQRMTLGLTGRPVFYDYCLNLMDFSPIYKSFTAFSGLSYVDNGYIQCPIIANFGVVRPLISV